MEKIPENGPENIENLPTSRIAADSPCSLACATWPPVADTADNKPCATDNSKKEQRDDDDMDQSLDLMARSPADQQQEPCMNPTYSCSRERVRGCEYCQKHIHLDPNCTEYKQCEYVYSSRTTISKVQLDPRRSVVTELAISKKEQEPEKEIRCIEYFKVGRNQEMPARPDFCTIHLLEWEAAMLREKHASRGNGIAVDHLRKLVEVCKLYDGDALEDELNLQLDETFMAERARDISERATIEEPSTSKKNMECVSDDASSVGSTDPHGTAGVYTHKELLREYMNIQEELIILYKKQEAWALSEYAAKVKIQPEPNMENFLENKGETDSKSNKSEGDGKSNKIDVDGKSNKSEGDDKSNKIEGDGKSNKSEGDDKGNKSEAEGKSNKSEADGRSNKSEGDDKSNKIEGDSKSNKSEAEGKSNKSEGDGKSDEKETSDKVTKSFVDQSKQRPFHGRLRPTREQQLMKNRLAEITEMREELRNGGAISTGDCDSLKPQCMGDGNCKNPLFWPGNCCLDHVLHDKRQCVFRPCGAVIDGIVCQKPVIRFPGFNRCQIHAERPKFLNGSDGKADDAKPKDKNERKVRESIEIDIFN